MIKAFILLFNAIKTRQTIVVDISTLLTIGQVTYKWEFVTSAPPPSRPAWTLAPNDVTSAFVENIFLYFCTMTVAGDASTIFDHVKRLMWYIQIA